jgi:hypothetical protein
MTREEEQHVREVLAFFFRDEQAPLAITPELATLAAEMLDAAWRASDAIDLLPRPPGFVPGAGWLVSQAVQIVWRKTGKQRIYEMVRKDLAWSRRSEYRMALQGL